MKPKYFKDFTQEELAKIIIEERERNKKKKEELRKQRNKLLLKIFQEENKKKTKIFSRVLSRMYKRKRYSGRCSRIFQKSS